MDDKYENMSFDELTKLSKDGDRDAEAELKLREMSEEEPPPTLSRMTPRMVAEAEGLFKEKI